MIVGEADACLSYSSRMSGNWQMDTTHFRTTKSIFMPNFFASGALIARTHTTEHTSFINERTMPSRLCVCALVMMWLWCLCVSLCLNSLPMPMPHTPQPTPIQYKPRTCVTHTHNHDMLLLLLLLWESASRLVCGMWIYIYGKLYFIGKS